jgi:hypothetical protein
VARFRIHNGSEIETMTLEELQGVLRPADGRRDGWTGVKDVVVGDFDHPEPVLMVVPPVRRVRVTRHGYGSDDLAVTSTTPILLVQQNEGRLGGWIVNYGVGGLFIYLANIDDLQGQEQHNRPALYLEPGGGSWDFGLTNCLWGGSVSIAAAANTVIAWGEF